jgi:hypothetical protein
VNNARQRQTVLRLSSAKKQKNAPRRSVQSKMIVARMLNVLKKNVQSKKGVVRKQNVQIQLLKSKFINAV